MRVTVLAFSMIAVSAPACSAQQPATIDAGVSEAAIKKETDIACLYHCDFGDPQRFSHMLQNILNHYSAYDFDSFRLSLWWWRMRPA